MQIPTQMYSLINFFPLHRRGEKKKKKNCQSSLSPFSLLLSCARLASCLARKLPANMSWRSLAALYVLYIRACEYTCSTSNQDAFFWCFGARKQLSCENSKTHFSPPVFPSELIFLGVYMRRRKNVPQLIFVVCCFCAAKCREKEERSCLKVVKAEYTLSLMCAATQHKITGAPPPNKKKKNPPLLLFNSRKLHKN